MMLDVQAKQGKRELAALGGVAVDLAAGRPSRRLGRAAGAGGGLLPPPQQLLALLDGGTPLLNGSLSPVLVPAAPAAAEVDEQPQAGAALAADPLPSAQQVVHAPCGAASSAPVFPYGSSGSLPQS